MTFPSGWGRRAPIVISACSDDLTNFPVHLDVSCFPLEALDSASANKALSTGADLRFSANENGTSELPFEVRRWTQDPNLGNRRANVHVKVPALSKSAATTIYVWYKNTSATMPSVTDANGAQAVWDSGYLGVWNLDSTTSIVSSASVGAAGTIEGSPTTTVDSPVGLALDLDGSNDAVHFGNQNSNDSLFEVVLKLDATSDQIVFGTSTSTPSANASLSTWVSGGYPTGFFDSDGGSTYQQTFADNVVANTTTWEYWTARNRSTAGTATSKARPATEQTHQSGVTDGVYLYSIGGHPNNPAAPLANNNRYNPSTDSWSAMTALPASRYGMASCYLNGKIYCIGGYTGSAASTRNDIYDVAGNSWSVGAAMPSSLTSTYTQGQRACTDGTYVYVTIGGVLERYDPIGNSWSTRTGLAGLGSYSSLICSGGYIYLIGGYTHPGNVYRYSISGDSWELWDTAPYTAWAQVCEPVGDGSWLFGFGRISTTEQRCQLYNYVPATKTWTRLRAYDLPTNACASAVISGRLYVYGAWVIGRTETYSFGHHACYNIATGTWETSPALMEFARNGVGAKGAITATALYAGAGNFYIGRQQGYASLFSGAKVAHVRRSNTARSKAWLKATSDTLLSASTFSVVGSPTNVSVYLVSAANSLQAISGSAGMVGQTHLVAAANGLQSLVSIAGALQQTHLITLAGAAQTHAAAAGSVSQTTITFVAGSHSAQGNAATAAAISQTHRVAGAASSQPAALVDALIRQIHQVAAGNGAQANRAAAGSASQSTLTFIVGSASAQAASASAGAIMQTHRVAAANGSQVNAATAAPVRQTHPIITAPVAVDHVASASSIVQRHLIMADSSHQGSVASIVSLFNAAIAIRGDVLRAHRRVRTIPSRSP